ncbi:3-oxo-Delta(4,5)-steroid 5-beta-reductase [Linum perenne]
MDTTTATATVQNPAAVALIVGVTGMVGLSLAEALNNPSTPGGPWKVYGVARRSLPTWFPATLLHQFISVDALDQQDTLLKLSPVASEVTHVFWVALVGHESEEVNISTNSAMISNVVHALSREDSGLKHFALQTGTKHYMGPVFDPNHSSKLVVHGPPWQEDMPRLPYPNFYYAQEDVLASSLPKGVTHSIHRSSIIMGATPRSHYNSMLTLAIYATICKYKSLPFRYPGNRYTWEHFCDMSDSRLLAEQQIWAATTKEGKNEAFNCTNGDFFTWKEMWKVLCRVFELEFDGDEEGGFDVAKMMMNDGMGRVWDEIVEKHGLVKTKLEEVTCFDAFTAVVRFEFQHVCSMNKSREFGFMGFYDTMKSVPYWVGRMREMKIIP